MLNYIKGEITEVNAKHITIETCGIGYNVIVPNPYTYLLNSNITLYVYYYIREDIHKLYGFSSNIEKDTFEKLISVKGLGPKTALAMLASSTPYEIADMVNSANQTFFAKFPGVGVKLSGQIILDLKNKFVFITSNNKSLNNNDITNEVMLALKSLGYKDSDIKNVCKKISFDSNTNTSDAIKKALRLLR